MHVTDLNLEEKLALMGLLAHVAMADGVVATGEIRELELLGEEMGIERLASAVLEARGRFPTPESLIDYVSVVERDDARELLRTIAMDLAQSDDARSREESRLLSEVTRVWARTG